MKRSARIFYCIALAVLAAALAGYTLLSASEPLGITVDRVEEGGGLQFCRYCGRSIRVGSIARDAEPAVDAMLREKMKERGIAFVESGDVKRFINIHIFRFQQRKGGNFAADTPSSVGFHMHLMEGTKVGRVYDFDEQQKPLMSNLLEFGKFVERGGRWITAERLAQEGIESGLNFMMEALDK